MWFKLDAAIYRNFKIRTRLGFAEVGWWVMLLALQKERSADAKPGAGTVEEIAYSMRVDIGEAAEVLASLVDKGFLSIGDGGVYACDSFEEWQEAGGGTTSAERMRKKRANDRVLASQSNQVTAGDVSRVTAGDGVTKSDALEESRKEENRIEKNVTASRILTRPSGRGDALDILAVIDSKPKPKPGELAEGFDEFIEKYPKQVKIDLALQTWMSLRDVGTLAPLPEILAGLDRWLESAAWEGENAKYVPQPHKWLLDSAWLDSPPKGEAAKMAAAIPVWTGPKRREVA